MSQPPYYPHVAPAARPHGRAALLQSILAGILLLFGTCTGAVILTFSPHQMYQTLPADVRSHFDAAQAEKLEKSMHREAVTKAPISLALGISLLVLAFFVRRASRPATIASCLITGLVTLAFFFETLGTPVGGIDGMVSLLIVGGLSALGIWTLVAQIRANAAPLPAAAAPNAPGPFPQIPQPPAVYEYGYQIPPPASSPDGESKGPPEGNRM